MSRFFLSILATVAVAFWTSVAAAQEFSALARLDADKSTLQDSGQGGVTLTLALSQGVPWRLFTLDAPRRLVLDFREVDWQGVEAEALDQAQRVTALRFGQYRPGWSRMVLDLATPMQVKTAGMQVDEASGSAMLSIRLTTSDAEQFAARAGAPQDPRWDLPAPSVTVTKPKAKLPGSPTVIVLDPGHGGIDPGAERGGLQEKQVMLTFARELRDTLRRAGGFEVHLTRDADVFVSLEGRVALAHQLAADVFVSLHADTVTQGHAQGATVYTLSEEASDVASQYLAERHNRADILAGIDLTGTDDLVANVLLDMVRTDTAPRSKALAGALVEGLKSNDGTLNRKPLRHAGFSVLKAADIPSVLIEVGFMSSERDLANLRDPEWRARMADGLRDGLQRWIIEDAASRALLRQ